MGATVAPGDAGAGKIEVTKPVANRKTLLIVLAIVFALGAVGGIVAAIVVATADSGTASSPPPPYPTGAAASHQVTTTFTASGNVADYTPAKVSGIKAVVASNAGVSASAVEVTVTPGSVVVAVAITLASAAKAETAAATLSAPATDGGSAGLFSSASALASALSAGGVSGVTVAEISAPPVAVVAFVYPPPSPAPVSPAAAPNAVLSILGHWVDNWGAYITVTSTMWISVSSGVSSYYTIDSFGDEYVIMQNAPDAGWAPSLWSKMQFHTVGSGFGYCHSVYDGATKADALFTDTTASYNKSESGKGGCSSFSHSVASPYNIPIAGTYLDNWGSYVTVTNDKWYSGTSTYDIEMYTNALLMYQNPADAGWNPSKWVKIEFHTVGNGFGHCQSVMDGETAAAALKADTTGTYNASESGPGGCASFSHTVASPYNMPIAGKWVDNWNTNLTITNTHWTSGSTTYAIEAYGPNWVIMQNAPDAGWNPSKWTKTEFHTVGNGFGYCQSVMDAETAAAALKADTTGTYNASESGPGGCASFSHSIASPRS